MSETHPIIAYIESKDAFDEADQQVRAVVSHFNSIVQRVNSWERLAIDGAEARLPQEADEAARQRLDASEWPQIETLAEALRNWHECRVTMWQKWEALAPEQQRNIAPPSS